MQSKIYDQVKNAMRARDTLRLLTLRSMLSAFTNELVSKGRKPNEVLADQDTVAVVRRLVKQRKDSIEQFEKGNRKDLADNERAELKILEEFLPAEMSEEKVREIILRKLEEFKQNGSTSSPQVGQFIGAVMKETSGQAGGTMVKRVVEDILR
jgi:uncharacterized protein YqeY